MINRIDRVRSTSCLAALLCMFSASGGLFAQSVCLPSPRLLTTMPMGGQAGSEVEVVISGQYLDEAEQLIFSNPGITALPKLDDSGNAVPNRFIVRIAEDCAPGVYDARVMARSGISSPRAFSVGELPEVTQIGKTTTLDTAMDLKLNSVCNAALEARAINHYRFEARAGRRVVIDCAAGGIDSKMQPVLILADASGSDLIVERRGGSIDFTVPEDGTYVVKVHDLTFKGGPHYFYRLMLREIADDATPEPMPSTQSVMAFSWPPKGLPQQAAFSEQEPNDDPGSAQAIDLPCDLTGHFFPAADADTFEFDAKKGEQWWVEIASERLGRPTDPFVVVQQIKDDGTFVDVAELNDIASPVKRSSNGYSYDGPPYNAGSSDVLGKFDVPDDGRYRIRVSDLFGGTRNDPDNVYRMIIRKAEPDFALVGWALHMGLRNGDRNALSKPISLRGGATMPFEIVVVRRDGFDGEIELEMEGLPEGVTATGLKIGAGQSRGILLVSADETAPRGLSFAKLFGKAVIDGQEVVRRCQLATMKWPVTNARNDIPDPRLVDQIPVSVGGVEKAALVIAPAEDKIWTAREGETLTIPLTLTRRGPFSGNTVGLETFGAGFERNPKFDISVSGDSAQATIDLARCKTPPGDHQVAFYGGAVVQYAYQPAGSEKQAKPKDIVDIYVSKPIAIHVEAAETSKK
jgi:hypothetical protein